MPAKYDLLPKYKSYIGRAFTLRKNWELPASTDKKAQTRRFYKRDEILAEACLVVDETNTRVKVTGKDSRFYWISKFYLHKELVGSAFEDHDYVVDLTDKLLNLTDVFEDLYENNDGSDGKKKIQKQTKDLLTDAAQALRQYADTLKNRK